jgi:acyl carrier protein
MKIVREDELVHAMKGWIKQMQGLPYAASVELTDETDLIASGIVDSLGFIELMVYLENITEEKIDLNEADPKDFTTIKGLCKAIMNQHHTSVIGGL